MPGANGPQEKEPSKQADLPLLTAHLVGRLGLYHDLLELTEPGSFLAVVYPLVQGGRRDLVERCRRQAEGWMCFFGWPSHQEGQERSSLDGDPPAAGWGMRRCWASNACKVGWRVGIAKVTCLVSRDPGPRAWTLICLLREALLYLS